MGSIRDLELPVVDGLLDLGEPLALDGGQDGAAVLGDEQGVGHGLRRPVAGGVEDARVRGVEEAVGEIGLAGPRADLVARVLRNVGEDVGADVVSAEGVEVPEESGE